MNAIPTTEPQQPQNAQESFNHAWIEHAKEKRYVAAEEGFRQALVLDPNLIDAYYGLGLALKAQGRRQEAAESFQKLLALLDGGAIEDRSRAGMLRRLTIGHMNQINKGDWDLEKEIWQKKA